MNKDEVIINMIGTLKNKNKEYKELIFENSVLKSTKEFNEGVIKILENKIKELENNIKYQEYIINLLENDLNNESESRSRFFERILSLEEEIDLMKEEMKGDKVEIGMLWKKEEDDSIKIKKLTAENENLRIKINILNRHK